jgi:hypothetical protein
MAAECLAALQDPENRGLGEIAETPLLLGLLCYYFRGHGDFPPDRSRIYSDALAQLLEEWDDQRNVRRDRILYEERLYKGLSTAAKEDLLSRIAYPSFADGQLLFREEKLGDEIARHLKEILPKERLRLGGINGRAVLRAMEAQHGILVEQARRVHSFAHLSFHEYYAARYVVKVQKADEEPLGQLLTHVADSRWREVILMTAGQLDGLEHEVFFESFLAQLGSLIQDEPLLNDFLGWAERKAEWLEMDVSLAGIRAFYTADALSRDFDRTLDRDFDRDFYLAGAWAQSLHFALDLAFARTLDFDLALTRALDLALDLDLDLALDLARDLTRARGSGQYLKNVIERAVESGEAKLATALAALECPDPETPEADWTQFSVQLRKIKIKYRDMGHQWDFSKDEVASLANYLYGAKLLVQCLSLAAVSEADRAPIEDQLLRPPPDTNPSPPREGTERKG